MFDKIKSAWTGVKAFFKHSETILLARIEMVTGLVIAGVNAMDWSPLLSAGIDAGFTVKQGLIMGGMLLTKGIVSEWARLRNAVIVNDKIVPTDLTPATLKKAKEVKEDTA